MKRLVLGLTLIFLIAIIAATNAQGPGWWGGGGMMGGGMMGPGYYGQSEECQKFFDETAPLRKELHEKRYEYFEASRNPKSTLESIAKFGKEIRELQQKIYSKAPQGCWY